MSELIELDERRRAALGKIGHSAHHRYLVDTLVDGTLIFQPAIVVTEMQARLWASPEVSRQLDKGAAAYRDDPTVAVRGKGLPKRRG